MPNKAFLVERREKAKLLENQKEKAVNKWKWKVPWVAFILAFVYPIGMLYTSLEVTAVYLLAWVLMSAYWERGSPWVNLVVSIMFAVYAYLRTKRKNAAIETWRYGLKGSGYQNPKAVGLTLKGPDDNRKFYPFF